MDKFFTLIRKMVYEILRFIKFRDFPTDTVAQLTGVLLKHAMIDASVGVLSHMADVFYDEVERAFLTVERPPGAPVGLVLKTSFEQALHVLLQPFSKVLCQRAIERRLVNKIDVRACAGCFRCIVSFPVSFCF